MAVLIAVLAWSRSLRVEIFRDYLLNESQSEERRRGGIMPNQATNFVQSAECCVP